MCTSWTELAVGGPLLWCGTEEGVLHEVAKQGSEIIEYVKQMLLGGALPRGVEKTSRLLTLPWMMLPEEEQVCGNTFMSLALDEL